jgi:hypothetical protein
MKWEMKKKDTRPLRFNFFVWKKRKQKHAYINVTWKRKLAAKKKKKAT